MTKPAPGPDQPPIPVRLVTFNTHHGVGEDERHDLPGWPAAGRGGRRRDLPAGGRPATSATAARTSTRRCCSPARWTCSWPGARRSTSRGPGGQPRRQYGNALLSRLPILISDVHRLPGGGRAAQRAAHHARARRRHAVGDHHAPDHPVSRSERAEQVAALAALHTELDGGRRPGRRLQRPPRRAGAGRAARAVRRRVGAGRATATTRRAGGSGSATRGHPPGARPRTGGSTRCGSPPASRSPRRRSWTPRAPPTTCRCGRPGGPLRRLERRVLRRSRARAAAG